MLVFRHRRHYNCLRLQQLSARQISMRRALPRRRETERAAGAANPPRFALRPVIPLRCMTAAHEAAAGHRFAGTPQHAYASGASRRPGMTKKTDGSASNGLC